MVLTPLNSHVRYSSEVYMSNEYMVNILFLQMGAVEYLGNSEVNNDSNNANDY